MQFIDMNDFHGPKKHGNQDLRLGGRIRASFICLIFTTLGYELWTYERGVFKDGDYFNYGNWGSKHKIYNIGIGSLTVQ